MLAAGKDQKKIITVKSSKKKRLTVFFFLQYLTADESINYLFWKAMKQITKGILLLRKDAGWWTRSNKQKEIFMLNQIQTNSNLEYWNQILNLLVIHFPSMFQASQFLGDFFYLNADLCNRSGPIHSLHLLYMGNYK